MRLCSFLHKQLYEKNMSDIMSEDQALNSSPSFLQCLVRLSAAGVYSCLLLCISSLVCPFFSYKCKNENTLYSYACMVYYSRLCSIPGTLLCHKQYDRPRHRKLNLSSFFFLPLFFRLHLLVIFFLSVCLWESTSLYSQTFTLLGTLSGVWTEL